MRYLLSPLELHVILDAHGLIHRARVLVPPVPVAYGPADGLRARNADCLHDFG